MSDEEYEQARKHDLETLSAQHFGVRIAVRTVLFDDLVLSPHTTMTVFSTEDNDVFATIESEQGLRLGDIENLVKKAGFSPSHYVAPGGHKSYFLQRAYNIFSAVYPGRSKWTTDEEAYYQLLVPYSPALVKLSGVRGPIRQYNRFGGTWEVAYQPSRRLQAV